MDIFPDSLLLEIFDFLNYEDLCLGVRATCTRWWRLTQDASLWKNVQIGDHFTDQRFILLLEQPFVHANVENLECSKCENLTAEAFDRLADILTPKLKKLCVPLISAFPPSIYAKLAKSCPQLEELENVGSKPEESIQPLHIQLMFPKLKALHDKPVASYGRIRSGLTRESDRKHQWMNDLSEVAFKCPDIEAYYCRRGLQYVNDDGLEKIGVLFPKLTKLELAYCSITDKGLTMFFENNQRGLTELIFDKPGDITDSGLRIIADNCPNLSNLKVSRCVGITNEGVVYMVRKCHALTELHLNNKVYAIEDDYVKTCDFTDDCVKVIGSECPKMIFLRLFYSSALTAAGIGGIGIGCSQLEGLMLYECPQVDDACLTEVAKHMPNLRALVMVGCDNVTPVGIIDLILVAPKLLRFTMFSNLTTPLFYGDLTDLEEITYSKICAEDSPFRPNVLRKLTLKGVGGPFLRLLTVLCPDLHTLDLRDGCIINNVALNSVIKNCENLTVLDIQNVKCVDESVLDTICEHAVKLRKLGLGRTVHKLSNTMLAKVISSCPSLKSIAMDTKDSDVDEELLMDIARSHHGGHCFLHVDYECRQPDNYLEENHRLVDLHFTPIKYLSSIHSWTAD